MPTAEQVQKIMQQMQGNSTAWHTADKNGQSNLSQLNQALGKSIGATYDPNKGSWDYSGVKLDAPQQPDYFQQMQSSIEQMSSTEKAQRLQALRAQQAKATGQLNQQKAELDPQYYGLKNQAGADNAQQLLKLKELIANNGLVGNTNGSGENITANVAHNAALQNQLGALDTQKQQAVNDFNRRIADVNDPSQEQSISAALDAEKARMLYDAQQRAVDYGRQDARNAVQDNFTRGQMTGYLDASPEVMAKVQDLVRLKQANATGGNADLGNQANVIRSYLASQGIDANRLFGADVTPEQALANIGQLRMPTLQRQGMDWEQNVQFPWQKSIQESGITGYFNGNPTFTREQFNADQAYRSQQLAATYAKMQQTAVRNGKQLPSLNQVDVPTQMALQKAMDFGNYDQAVSSLNDSASYLNANGVDVNRVKQYIDYLYGLPDQRRPEA